MNSVAGHLVALKFSKNKNIKIFIRKHMYMSIFDLQIILILHSVVKNDKNFLQGFFTQFQTGVTIKTLAPQWTY